MIKFSIVIPVRTINDYLKESIPHIKKLDYPNFEVIIVVDEVSDYNFEGDKRFKIVVSPEGHRSPGEKRNQGAKEASGDILAFLDDDAYPKKDWLSQAAKIFEEDPNLYALGAPAMTPKDAGLLEKASGFILESYLVSGFTNYRHIPKPRRYINDYPTVNLFVKKEAFNAIGGFDKEFWPGEDTKLCLDLIKYYKRDFLYDPKPQVYHHRRNVFLPHLKQISRYGRHRGQFARIFPETSLIPSYFIPSLFLLGLIIGPFVSMVFPFLWIVYKIVLFIYWHIIFIFGIKYSVKEKNAKIFVLFSLGTFLTHTVYGANIIIGLFKRPKLKLRDFDKKTGNYLGG